MWHVQCHIARHAKNKMRQTVSSRVAAHTWALHTFWLRLLPVLVGRLCTNGCHLNRYTLWEVYVNPCAFGGFLVTVKAIKTTKTKENIRKSKTIEFPRNDGNKSVCYDILKWMLLFIHIYVHAIYILVHICVYLCDLSVMRNSNNIKS